MFELDYPEISALHQEAIYRQATNDRLVRLIPHSRLRLTGHFAPALGDILISIGQRLKDSSPDLKAEPYSITTLTITL